MKKFKIEVINKEPQKIDGLLSFWGRITIGNFSERFIMPIDSWSLDEYKQQWKDGLERIKTHSISCFVVTVQNLNMNPLIEFWTLYKEGSTIFFHNELLNRTIAQEQNFPIKLSEFSSKTCYQFITPRIVNEKGEGISEYNGDKISEWHIDINELST